MSLKEVKCTCPACGQHLVSQEKFAAVECPGCRQNIHPRWRRPIYYWVVVAMMLAGIGTFGVRVVKARAEAGWGGPSRSESETGRERLDRLRREAPTAARSAVTNQVGFYRLIACTVDTSDGNPNRWTGSCEFEVIKGAVGVERRSVSLVGRQVAGAVRFSIVQDEK